MKALLDMTIAELVDEFEYLDSWEERCEYLIDLGFELPAMPEVDKSERNRVHGCQSLVWMTLRPLADEGAETRLTIRADSDAMIVRGLIAILLTVYDGKASREILETDIAILFTRLGLDRHLSVARKNGLAGMVKRIREEAVRLGVGG